MDGKCHVHKHVWGRPLASQGPLCTSIVICNILTHSSSNTLDWVSIERSMDEYWTKYGAGMVLVLGQCIVWHIPTK